MFHADLSESLRVSEIFYSIQGEGLKSGIPTVFVRLSGCPLRCRYCDTEYAFRAGEKRTISAIEQAIAQYNCAEITVTGGEPLAQPGCSVLLSRLCDLGFSVSLETSGALSVESVDQRVFKVLDLKTPSSGECAKNLFANLDHINAQDQIKFVIGNREDYEWSVARVEEFGLTERCTVLFSPVYKQLSESVLAEWILADQLSVRFQVQLHKVLWGEERGK